MSLQECLDGEVYYCAARPRGLHLAALHGDLTELVTLSHDAKLSTSTSCHERDGGSQIRHAQAVRLQIPPRAAAGPFVGLALKLGLLGRESRDRASSRASTTSIAWNASCSKFYKAARRRQPSGLSRPVCFRRDRRLRARWRLPVHGRDSILDRVRELARGHTISWRASEKNTGPSTPGRQAFR
jgi:hypothetical protein